MGSLSVENTTLSSLKFGFDTWGMSDSRIFSMVKAINLWIFPLNPNRHDCIYATTLHTDLPQLSTLIFIFNEFPLTNCLTLVGFAEITVGLKFSKLFNWEHTEKFFLVPVVALDKSDNDFATKFFQTSLYTLAYSYFEGIIPHLWNNLIFNFLFIPARVWIVCINATSHFCSA